MAKDAKSTRIRRGARRTCSAEQRAAELHVLELVESWLKHMKDNAESDRASADVGSYLADISRGRWHGFDQTLTHVQRMMAQRRRAAK